MEDFYRNNISENGSYNDSYDNNPRNYHDALVVVTWIIITIGLSLTVVAICALYSLIRKDHVAPVYVINLLISDLIQFCCMIAEVAKSQDWSINGILIFIHLYSLMVSVGFMVCIALERYLIIAWPLWYRCRRTIKTSVVVCVLIWALNLVFAVIGFAVLFILNKNLTARIMFGIFFLFPCPLFIFFLVGTLKALSASISVTSDEKRRIVGILVLVLLIYTLLFLPTIILFSPEKVQYYFTFNKLSYIFAQLSPLADLLLYIFMRKGMIDKLLASVCCCKMDNNDSSTSSV